MGIVTWSEAIKSALVALPIIGRIVEWFLGRWQKKEDERGDVAEQDDLASLDPDAVGPRLRDRLRRDGPAR